MLGAVVGGVVYFFARSGADWVCRYYVPGYPLPPMWSLLLPQLFGASVVTALLFLLLGVIQQQHKSMQELNHGLRNALEIICYLLPQLPPEARTQGNEAVARIVTTVRVVSKRLGVGMEEATHSCLNVPTSV